MEAYQKSFGDIQNELGVFNQGLNKSQIDKYKHLFGKNEIIEEKHESTLIIFVNQFKDLLVIILIAAGIISAISGEFESTIDCNYSKCIVRNLSNSKGTKVD